MTLPWLARKLLALSLPWDRNDDVVGDLEELHARRVQQMGPTLANLFSSMAALGTALAFLLIRLREKDLRMPLFSRLEFLLAVRLLRKQPVLSATSVLSLTVGIAIAAMGFTMIDAAVNSTLDVPNGERFVRFVVRDTNGDFASFNTRDFALLAPHAVSFEHIGAQSVATSNVRHANNLIETVRVNEITPSSLPFLNVTPILGRALLPTDNQPGAPPVAWIRESIWQRSYQGEGEALGQSVLVNGAPYEIVGVVPDSLQFPAGGEIWLPLTTPRS